MSPNIDKSTWKRVAFGDVIDSITERINDPAEAGVDRYVGLEHLDPGVMTVQRWDTPDKVAAQKLRFKAKDVIFARRRAYQKKVAMAEFEGICSAHALVLRARPDYIHPDFLPVFLSSDYFLERAIAISVGSLSPTVNWRDLKVQEFDLPPLDEQERIANLLWAVEHGRRSLRGLSESLATTTDQLLSTQLRPGGENISKYADILVGFAFPSSSFSRETSSGSRSLLRGINIGVGETRWDDSNTVSWMEPLSERTAKFVLAAGDIVIPMDRPFTADGRLRWAELNESEAGTLLVQRVARLRVRNAAFSPLLRGIVRSSPFQSALNGSLTGSFAPHLAHGDFVRYQFHAPSPSHVAESLSSAEVAETANERERDCLDSLRGSLFDDIFGGN